MALTSCTEETPPRQAQPPVRQDPVILELQSAEAEPIGLLSYGGEDQAGGLGTHCWAIQCVDFTGPPTPKTFTEVPGDAVIEVIGDSTAQDISVGTLPEEEFGQPGNERQVKVKGGRARLDLEPGRYVLVVFATWSEGDAVLSFGLEVR